MAETSYAIKGTFGMRGRAGGAPGRGPYLPGKLNHRTRGGGRRKAEREKKNTGVILPEFKRL